MKGKLFFYKRIKPSGQNAGYGWHTKTGAKKLRKEGFKLIPSK